MVLLSALCLTEQVGDDEQQFCATIGLRPKALKEIRKLRRQLSTEVEALIPQVILVFFYARYLYKGSFDSTMHLYPSFVRFFYRIVTQEDIFMERRLICRSKFREKI